MNKKELIDLELIEIFQLNNKLIELGNALVLSIIKYGKYSKYGMSPHMKEATVSWESFIQENFNKFYPNLEE